MWMLTKVYILWEKPEHGLRGIEEVNPTSAAAAIAHYRYHGCAIQILDESQLNTHFEDRARGGNGLYRHVRSG